MERSLRDKLPGGKFQDVSPIRSKAMAAVRGKGNKTTEKRLRMAMVQAGIKGWVLHPKGVLGRPDFFFPDSQVAVFVDGCFWHGCPMCGHVPKANNAFWSAKIARNRERDTKTNERLAAEGIRAIRIWEHELASELGSCVVRLKGALKEGP